MVENQVQDVYREKQSGNVTSIFGMALECHSKKLKAPKYSSDRPESEGLCKVSKVEISF